MKQRTPEVCWLFRGHSHIGKTALSNDLAERIRSPSAQEGGIG